MNISQQKIILKKDNRIYSKTPDRILSKYMNTSVILEDCDTKTSHTDFMMDDTPRSDVRLTRPFTNINDPLIQTTPIMVNYI